MSVPVAYATVTSTLPSKPYILSITPSPSNPHLILRHPSSTLTLVDNQSLQPIDQFRGGHEGNIMDVKADGGAVWSGGKDAGVVRWDERSRTAATKIKAVVRKPLPVLSVAASEADHLVMAGTELLSSEAHIIFWDTRSTKQPVYIHSSTHSDDITHLSLLPPSTSFLPRSQTRVLPERLLLSASTDGLVALSDLKETDEDEAVQSAENFGQSIAKAGWYERKGQMRIWGRSDMDSMGVWSVAKGEEEEIEMQDLVTYETERFRSREFIPQPEKVASTTRTAEEERQGKNGRIHSDYLIDAIPSLGISSHDRPMTAVGTNGGDIVLLHGKDEWYQPSGYFLTHPTPTAGHKDVVRAMHHDITNQALYTGSEDGVLSGWSLASLPTRLQVGDKELDDALEEDDDDGDDDDRSEESEIETEESEDGMDVDEDQDGDGREPGPRNGPTIGAGGGAGADRRERKKERTRPY